MMAEGVKDVAEGMSVKLTEDVRLQVKLKELILRQRPEGLAGALRAMAERPDIDRACWPALIFRLFWCMDWRMR